MTLRASVDEFTALIVAVALLILRSMAVNVREWLAERRSTMAKDWTHVRLTKRTRDALQALGSAWHEAYVNMRPAPSLDMADGPPSADQVVGELVRLYYDHLERSRESARKRAQRVLGPDGKPAAPDSPPIPPDASQA